VGKGSGSFTDKVFEVLDTDLADARDDRFPMLSSCPTVTAHARELGICTFVLTPVVTA
jgi:hypothetical protein